MPCIRNPAPVPYTTGQVTNWAGNITVAPLRLYQPSTVDELVSIVREAEQNGVSVHASGSAWSFTDIWGTNGYLIQTDNLSRILSATLCGDGTPLDNNGAIQPGTADPVFGALTASARQRFLCHVECGIKIHDLHDQLDSLPVSAGGQQHALKLALKTLGGSGGQSIVGAASTSTHGGDDHDSLGNRISPLPDMIQAVHLIAPGGVEFFIQGSAQNAIVDPSVLAQAMPCVAGNIISDDRTLRAVAVSCGRMGVIYSVVLEVRPQYFLAETTSHTTWNTLLTTPGAITSLRTNRFLEIVIFPFADGSGDRTCYTVTRTEVPVDSPVTEGGGGFDPLGFLCSAPSPVFTGILAGMIIGLAAAIAPLLAIPIIGPVLAAGDILVMTLLTSVVLTSVATTVAGIANALSTLGGPFIGMAVTLTNSLLTTGLSTPFRQDVSYKIMDTQNYGESNCDYKALSLEVAFDADNTTYQDFLQALFGQIDSFLANSKLYGGYISLRYCGGSDALLGIEQWPHTVCIELAMLQGLNYAMEILTSFKTLAVETFGATLHWGQLNDLSRSDVERSYPKKIDAWRRVLARLARRGSLNTFDNSFCSSHGLEVYATRPVDVSYLVPLLLSK